VGCGGGVIRSLNEVLGRVACRLEGGAEGQMERVPRRLHQLRTRLRALARVEEGGGGGGLAGGHPCL
jgi:hypothetical protein